MDASAIRTKIQAVDKTLAELEEKWERGHVDIGRYSRLKTDLERQKAEWEIKLTSPPQVEGPEDIGFVDREDELQLVQVERLRAARSPYTLLDAPAGYGKSCLLRHLLYTIQADESTRKRWRFRYVDFSQEAKDQVAHVVRVIADQALGDGPDAALNLIHNTVTQKLAAPSPQGRCAGLLIFDAVERLHQASKQWLYQLLHQLYQRTHPGPQEIFTVRVIIAGRDAREFWEGCACAYPGLPAPRRTINLGPLDQGSICDLIRKQARAVQIPLDDPTVDQIAGEVQYLSGGHPAVIRRLVDDLSSQSFAIGPALAYYRRHGEKLLQTHLSPVADDLLQGLNKLAPVVQALSVFRRLNANTVQTLVKANVLPPRTNGVDLLGDLSALHLLESPSIREPFYRDRLIRRVLALDLAHRSQESHACYQGLNQAALGLYEGWIRQGQALPDSYLKATQRLLSVVEWLFHALQDDDTDEDGLRLGLQEHITILSEGGPASSVAGLIAAEIEQDAELCYLLRHRLGDDGVFTVCNWLTTL